MKSVWKGSLSFGMVNIPVKLYSAVSSRSGFRLLHEKCKSPLKYKRYCPECEEEVEWEDVVKGLEVGKNKYKAFSKEKLEKLKPEKTSTIHIVEFIDKGQVDPIYLNKHYYCIPKQEKEKAYFLFKEVLQSSAKAAIGKFVMKSKEYICAIEPYKKGLLLTTLNYQSEIRDINKVEELQEKPRLKKDEKKLGKQLINKLTEKELDMSQFKATFTQELKKIMERIEKGEEVKVEKPKKKKKNLVKALKASLDEG